MMKKHAGMIILIIGIAMAAFLFLAKSREDFYIRQLMLENESCFLDDGTCLHADRDITVYIIGSILSGALILLGAHLAFFDKADDAIARQQYMTAKALAEASRQEREKDEFKAYLAGFGEDEQRVLTAIRQSDGIKQSTLRYRTGMSKASLSLLLQSLEKEGHITRKQSGKTYEVFFRKNF